MEWVKLDSRHSENEDMYLQNYVWFGSSAKTFNVESLYRIIIIETNRYIVNNTSGSIYPDMATSIQYQNTRSSIYMNRNNNSIYKELIQSKIIIRLLIKNIIPIKKIQGSEDSYLITTFSTINCNNIKGYVANVWGRLDWLIT